MASKVFYWAVNNVTSELDDLRKRLELLDGALVGQWSTSVELMLRKRLESKTEQKEGKADSSADAAGAAKELYRVRFSSSSAKSYFVSAGDVLEADSTINTLIDSLSDVLQYRSKTTFEVRTTSPSCVCFSI